MICINLSCYEDILHKRELTGGRSNGKSFSLIFSEMFSSPRNYMYEGATLAICRGGGMSSNLGGGGALLNFHLHCSLGGASRHLACTRSQVHFGLVI